MERRILGDVGQWGFEITVVVKDAVLGCGGDRFGRRVRFGSGGREILGRD